MKGLRAAILDCGYTLMDSNFIISMDTFMTEAQPDAPRKWYKCPTYCVLLQHPDAGNILFDLGTRADNASYAPKPIAESDVYHGSAENDLKYQLSLVGLVPKDIQHIIISHMHYDHIGNLHYFKNTAQFYISRPELEHAFTSVCQSLNPEDHGFYIRAEVMADFNRVNIIDDDTTLFEGIELLLLPGHTPGVLGAVVELESGPVILPSDAIYGAANFAGAPPGIIADTLGFYQSLKKVKQLQQKRRAKIWFSHDGQQFDTLQKAPFFYE